MVILWAVGGLLVTLGVVMVVASLLQRGGAAENPRLWVVAGLVMTGIGVVAISAAALADDDDGDDRVAAGDQTGAATSPDGPAGGGEDGEDGEGRGDGFGPGGPGDEGGGPGGGGDDPDEAGPSLPSCFDEHLTAEPVVAEDDHVRLDEGVNRQVIVTMHQADGIALELVDDGELLGVMRVGDQAVPVSDVLHVFDVVDEACQPVAFTPQETDDEVADTHQTVIPLDLGGRSYEITFVQQGIQPELDVVLRQAA